MIFQAPWTSNSELSTEAVLKGSKLRAEALAVVVGLSRIEGPWFRVSLQSTSLSPKPWALAEQLRFRVSRSP